jgi:hypothetical protein
MASYSDAELDSYCSEAPKPTLREIAAYSDAELDCHLEENGRSAFKFHHQFIAAVLILSAE